MPTDVANPGAVPPDPPADLAERLQNLKDAAGAAADQQRVLNQELRSAGYRAVAADVIRIEQANQRIAQAMREQADLAARRGNVRSGAYSQVLAEEAAMARRRASLERLEQRHQNAQRRADLNSGRYGRDAQLESDSRTARALLEEQERSVRLAQRAHEMGGGGGLQYDEHRLRKFQNDYREQRLAESEQRWQQQRELAQRREAVGSGQYATDHEQQRAVEIDADRLKLAERRAYVMSGGYGRELGELRRLRVEKEHIEQLERRAGLQARYGATLGGLAYRYGGIAAGAGRVAGHGITGSMAAFGLGAGAVYSGVSGTVEMERFQLQLGMTTRQLAGAFKPVIESTITGLSDFRDFLKDAGPTGQRVIRTLGVGLAAHTGLRILTGQGLVGWGQSAAGWLSQRAAMNAAAAGPGSAIVGAGARGVASQLAPSIAAGVAEGAVIRGATPTVTRMAAIRAGATRAGVYGAAVYSAYRTILDPSEDAPESKYRQEHVRSIAEQNPEYAGLSTREEFERAAVEARAKETGAANFTKRHLGALGADVWDALRSVTGYEGKRDDFRPLSDRLKEQADLMDPRKRKGPDELTLSGGGFGESGSSYDRLSEGLTMVAGAGTPSSDRNEELRRIRAAIEKVAENTAPKPDSPALPPRGG